MENQITATYDSDSKRYHRFLISEGQGITGTIYVPKDMKVPDSVTIQLRTKEETEKKNDLDTFLIWEVVCKTFL